MEKLIDKVRNELVITEDELSNTRKAWHNLIRTKAGVPQEIQDRYWKLKNKIKVLRRSFIYLNRPEDLYSDYNYWKRHGSMRNWEIKLGKELVPLFNIKNVVDFGCGLGSYLEGILEAGAEKVRGFDLLFNTTKEAIPEGIRQFISYGNAGEPIDCGKWDCAMSIEVAEHLVEEQADIFVDNLVNASERIIILTASNAGGKYHLNRQLKPYWIKKFEDRGCKYSEEDSKKLCDVWQKCGCPRYILNNIMIFYK